MSCVRAVTRSLDRIASTSHLNAFTNVVQREDALKEAAASDMRHASGTALSAIDGLPFAVKDNLATSKFHTTAGSKCLEHFNAGYDATSVSRLISAGAILVGKTGMDEFGMGCRSDSGVGEPVLNPSIPGSTPGGSSGGSAAAVAAGCVPFALGSDTGGSVRQPSAFCKVFGAKPSYGRISRWGLVSYASSLDVVVGSLSFSLLNLFPPHFHAP